MLLLILTFSFLFFLSSIAWGGVILPVGFASGDIPQVQTCVKLWHGLMMEDGKFTLQTNNKISQYDNMLVIIGCITDCYNPVIMKKLAIIRGLSHIICKEICL